MLDDEDDTEEHQFEHPGPLFQFVWGHLLLNAAVSAEVTDAMLQRFIKDASDYDWKINGLGEYHEQVESDVSADAESKETAGAAKGTKPV